MKRTTFLFIILFICTIELFGQNFGREIKLQNPRMNGQDIKMLQERLLLLGFTKIGEADGYYGPLTAGVICDIKLFLGFDVTGSEYLWGIDNFPDGSIKKNLWEFLFNDEYENILKVINVITSYYYREYQTIIERPPMDGSFSNKKMYNDYGDSYTGEVNILKVTETIGWEGRTNLSILCVFYNRDIFFVITSEFNHKNIYYQDLSGTYSLNNGVFLMTNKKFDYEDIVNRYSLEYYIRS